MKKITSLLLALLMLLAMAPLAALTVSAEEESVCGMQIININSIKDATGAPAHIKSATFSGTNFQSWTATKTDPAFLFDGDDDTGLWVLENTVTATIVYDKAYFVDNLVVISNKMPGHGYEYVTQISVEYSEDGTNYSGEILYSDVSEVADGKCTTTEFTISLQKTVKALKVTAIGDGVAWWSGLSEIYTNGKLGSHNYAETVLKMPTCTEEGEKVYRCACGAIDYTVAGADEKGVVVMPKIAHVFANEGDLEVTEQPSCTEAGKGNAKSECLVCGASGEVSIPALGHDYQISTVMSAPTETSTGRGEFTCSRCSNKIQKTLDEISLSNRLHTLTADDVTFVETLGEGGASDKRNPAALFDGNTEDDYWVPTGMWSGSTGSSLEITLKEPRIVIALNMYLYSNWNTAKITFYGEGGVELGSTGDKTFDTGNNMEKSGAFPFNDICAGKKLTKIRIDVVDDKFGLEHDGAIKFTEFSILTHECTFVLDTGKTVEKEATCTEAGLYKNAKCDSCGATYDEHVVAALGHNMSNYVASVNATCTETGLESRFCKTCGYKSENEVREIPALGHDFGNFIQTKAPDCSNKGYKEQTCKRCDAVNQEILAPLGHTYGAYVHMRDASCDETGLDIRYCSSCGLKNEKEIPALGHNTYSETVEGSCTEEGYTLIRCRDCDFEERRNVVPALGHVFEDEIDDEGEFVGRFCKYCGEEEIEEPIDDPTEPDDPTDPDEPTEQGILQMIMDFIQKIIDFFKSLLGGASKAE